MAWDDNLSPDEQRAWDSFVADVRADLVHKIAESSFVMSLAPGGEPDVKLAVETGFAVLLDKPIIAVAIAGQAVPPGLRRIAHAVIELDDIDTEAGRLELQRKLVPIMQEFGES